MLGCLVGISVVFVWCLLASGPLCCFTPGPLGQNVGGLAWCFSFQSSESFTDRFTSGLQDEVVHQSGRRPRQQGRHPKYLQRERERDVGHGAVSWCLIMRNGVERA